MVLDEPIFFDTDGEKILADIKAEYEALIGFVLAPGQAETLILNAFAYRFQLALITANEAAKQNLLAFAKYPMIDYLGDFLGVERLGPDTAKCKLKFNLVEDHPELVIPKGVRVQSIDTKAVFITLEDVNVELDDEFVLVEAECTSEGIIGNGYEVGEISIVLDPQAYVDFAQNNEITAGGSNAETDDGLRERIRLAPSSFSSAGTTDAYKFFARSAHASIIDVGVNSPEPGIVAIYPLMAGGIDPSEQIITAIETICNSDRVKALNDTIEVVAPSKNNYAITVNLTLKTGAIELIEKARVEESLLEYANKRKTKLGVDAVISQISAAASSDKIYNVEVELPATDITASSTQIAFCTAITVNVIGFSNE